MLGLGFGDVAHGSVVMKREALGVGGAAAHFSKNARSGAPSQFCILQALKNEGRYNRDAGEGGHPPRFVLFSSQKRTTI